MFETMRKHRVDPEAEREIMVIDLAVANGETGRPEDAELTDFALKLRGTRPLPNAGEIARLDARVAEIQTQNESFVAKSPRRNRRKLTVAAVSGCFVLALVGAGITSFERGGGDLMLPSQTSSAPESDRGTALGVTEAQPQTQELQKGAAADEALTQDDSAARVETRSTNMTLAVPDTKVAEASDGVIAATDRYGGYVTRSNVSSGDAFSRASLELMIPSADYQAALASISSLGHIRERSQSTEDITTPYRRAESSLERAVKNRDRLSRQRAAATTDAERNALTIRLRRAIRQVAAERQQLNALERQASFVAMSILIVGDDAAARAGESTIEAAWRVSKDLLAKIAAALIVVIAVLLPFAIFGGIGFVLVRSYRRRREDSVISASASGEASAQSVNRNG